VKQVAHWETCQINVNPLQINLPVLDKLVDRFIIVQLLRNIIDADTIFKQSRDYFETASREIKIARQISG
jgi:hypothetical protein